ncbi:type III secretion system export apparatus subunit SctS [Paraburkholderia sediminicola]|uniref:type III secretion system export apparatus subunit SctS n=1 Tax=Paraburkholderia sediminicola TaxID=458836 RepID=UPI0038B7A5B5
MNNAAVLQLASDALWVSMIVSAPIVIATAVAGIFTGLIQVMTQIQDQTMQFLTKLIVACITLAFTANWTGTMLVNFTKLVFSRIELFR